MMNDHSLSVQKLKEIFESGYNIRLIDVREPFEHEMFNIGGTLIPMEDALSIELDPNDSSPVVFYCEKGIRSEIVVQRLMVRYPLRRLLNLTGGMSAWKKAFGQ